MTYDRHEPKSACNRRESQISHVRVGREGKVLANRMRKLMSWYAQ